MTNEEIGKVLNKVTRDLWDAQLKVAREATDANPLKEATLKLVHEYDCDEGEHNVYMRCNTTIAKKNERPVCETCTFPTGEHLPYDPEVVDDIIRELLQAVNQRVELALMNDFNMEEEDVASLFKEYWRAAMQSINVTGFAASPIVVLGTIIKVTVTVS